MLATKNTYIQSAYKTLQVISQDDEKQMEYKARETAIRDYNQGLLEAEQRGEERGRQRAMEKSIRAIILDNIEEQIPQERTIQSLKTLFDLNENQARQYYEKYLKTSEV